MAEFINDYFRAIYGDVIWTPRGTEHVPPTNPLPRGPFSIIYADPPWSFKVYSDKGKDRSADQHYKVMTKEDIQRLPVGDIAAADCILFLWVTAPCLEEGIELIGKWGFTYKTVGFTWVKRNKVSWSWFWGMGSWTRSNAEFCLIATKGNPKRSEMGKGVHSIIESRIREHSRKPDEARDRIVKLMGDLPRVELFGRETHDGWSTWGNETEKLNT